MKKLISVCLAAFLTFSLSACGKGEETSAQPNNNQEETNLKIVTTTFPAFDFARNLAEGVSGAEVVLLNDTGADLHSYQATTDDVMEILSSDVFVYVGGQSDKWAKEALDTAKDEDKAVINLLESLGDRAKFLEENKEMEKNHSHSHNEFPDEHVWVSLKNAEIFCRDITDALISKDEKNKSLYEENLKSYLAELDTLDKEYEEVISNSEKSAVIFGDRFPFLYLTSDYGLSYYAAFLGCSAESEASFDVVTYLANKVDELSLNAILTIEKSDQKIAETIKQNTQSKSAEILTLNSMQSVSKKEINDGASYIGIMKDNLETLKIALS